MSPSINEPHGGQKPLTRLREIALLFLKLGTVSFGGPAAHIAMMHEEVVTRRHWISREEFLDLIGATNLIPGPNSTELAIHIGHRRGGWLGLVIAGVCFILPAAVIVTVCAWAYVEYRTLPEASAFLYGVKPAMIALVLNALIELGRTAIKTWFLASLFLSGVVLGLAGMNEILILIVAAVAAGAAHLVFDGRRTRPDRTRLPSGFFIALTLQGTTAAAGGIPSFSLSALFLFFLKVGSVLFGSGYVLLAFLRADLVERWHWLTETQLLDAIAVGQLTPGPVFTAATFIGYLLGGSAGAVAATAGIFLPAFLFVSVSGPLIPRIRRSPVAGAVLNGVNAASLSLMAVVTYQLGRSALIDLWSWLICAASAAVVFRYHINPVWIVAGGAVTGLLVHNRGMR